MTKTTLETIDWVLIAAGGLVILAAAVRWRLNSSLHPGRRDFLRHSPLRANSLGLMGPWVCIAGTLLGISAGPMLAPWFAASLPPDLLKSWQSLFTTELTAVFNTILGLLVAGAMFARGLKGFGIGRRKLGYELAVALAGWLAALCLTGVIVFATEAFLRHYRPDYHPPEHGVFLALKDPATPTWMRVFTITGTLLLVPIGEEVLFRGILQTAIQRLIPVRYGSFQHRWASIIIVSALFGFFHSTPQFIPALIALAILLGYLYERTGSLVVPIIIHILFNGKSLLFDYLARTYL